MSVRKGRGYVYDLRYHIVFCVKYRNEVLHDAVVIKLKEIFEEIAHNSDFEILEQEVMPEHVHLLIACKPQHYIPNIIKAIKGNSGRFLFKSFPDLKKRLWGGHLWNPSYFVSSVSDTTAEMIRNYIRTQTKRK